VIQGFWPHRCDSSRSCPVMITHVIFHHRAADFIGLKGLQ
jgi:hypothetical protein